MSLSISIYIFFGIEVIITMHFLEPQRPLFLIRSVVPAIVACVNPRMLRVLVGWVGIPLARAV